MTVDLTAIEIERRLTAIETTLETTLPTFATKADVHSLKADMHALRTEIQASRAEWKSDLHSLTRWMVIAVLGSITAATTITGLIVRFIGA